MLNSVNAKADGKVEPIIKGFQIGMSYDEAVKNIERLGYVPIEEDKGVVAGISKESYDEIIKKYNEVSKQKDFAFESKEKYVASSFSRETFLRCFFKDNKLNSYDIFAMKEAFGYVDTGEEKCLDSFLQNFANAYKISLTPRRVNSRIKGPFSFTEWKYENSNVILSLTTMNRDPYHLEVKEVKKQTATFD